jgi:rSAM/selenodomain-associated transferase 1
MNRHESALLIFARAPEPGKTKTRLIPALGPERATELHRSLIIYTLEQATRTACSAIRLYCFPDTTHSFFQECEQRFNVDLYSQQGKDLGERMLRAFQETMVDHTHAVLIGSDCPGISSDILDRAGLTLASGNDAVIGPSRDGGYYLIGLRRMNAGLFKDMPWGTERVADITRQHLRENGWSWTELPVLRDIDTISDLEAWQGGPEGKVNSYRMI